VNKELARETRGHHAFNDDENSNSYHLNSSKKSSHHQKHRDGSQESNLHQSGVFDYPDGNAHRHSSSSTTNHPFYDKTFNLSSAAIRAGLIDQEEFEKRQLAAKRGFIDSSGGGGGGGGHSEQHSRKGDQLKIRNMFFGIGRKVIDRMANMGFSLEDLVSMFLPDIQDKDADWCIFLSEALSVLEQDLNIELRL
jgi:hypothetical protein